METPSPSRSSSALERIVHASSGGSGSKHSGERHHRGAILKKSPTKPKRLQSAHIDETTGTWRCRKCAYNYPNPNPHHHQRRAHKKICPGERHSFRQDSGRSSELDTDEAHELSAALETADTASSEFFLDKKDSNDGVDELGDDNLPLIEEVEVIDGGDSSLEGAAKAAIEAVEDKQLQGGESAAPEIPASEELKRESETQDVEDSFLEAYGEEEQAEKQGIAASGESSELQGKEGLGSESTHDKAFEFKPHSDDLGRKFHSADDLGRKLDNDDLSRKPSSLGGTTNLPKDPFEDLFNHVAFSFGVGSSKRAPLPKESDKGIVEGKGIDAEEPVSVSGQTEGDRPNIGDRLKTWFRSGFGSSDGSKVESDKSTPAGSVEGLKSAPQPVAHPKESVEGNVEAKGIDVGEPLSLTGPNEGDSLKIGEDTPKLTEEIDQTQTGLNLTEGGHEIRERPVIQEHGQEEIEVAEGDEGIPWDELEVEDEAEENARRKSEDGEQKKRLQTGEGFSQREEVLTGAEGLAVEADRGGEIGRTELQVGADDDLSKEKDEEAASIEGTGQAIPTSHLDGKDQEEVSGDVGAIVWDDTESEIGIEHPSLQDGGDSGSQSATLQGRDDFGIAPEGNKSQEVGAAELEPGLEDENVIESPSRSSAIAKLSSADRNWEDWEFVVRGEDKPTAERETPVHHENDDAGGQFSVDGSTPQGKSDTLDGDTADKSASVLESEGAVLTGLLDFGNKADTQAEAEDRTEGFADADDKAGDKLLGHALSTASADYLSGREFDGEEISGELDGGDGGNVEQDQTKDQPKGTPLRVLSAAEANWDDWDDVIKGGPMLNLGFSLRKTEDLEKSPGEYQTPRVDSPEFDDLSGLGQEKRESERVSGPEKTGLTFQPLLDVGADQNDFGSPDANKIEGTKIIPAGMVEGLKSRFQPFKVPSNESEDGNLEGKHTDDAEPPRVGARMRNWLRFGFGSSDASNVDGYKISAAGPAESFKSPLGSNTAAVAPDSGQEAGELDIAPHSSKVDGYKISAAGPAEGFKSPLGPNTAAVAPDSGKEAGELDIAPHSATAPEPKVAGSDLLTGDEFQRPSRADKAEKGKEAGDINEDPSQNEAAGQVAQRDWSDWEDLKNDEEVHSRSGHSSPSFEDAHDGDLSSEQEHPNARLGAGKIPSKQRRWADWEDLSKSEYMLLDGPGGESLAFKRTTDPRAGGKTAVDLVEEPIDDGKGVSSNLSGDIAEKEPHQLVTKRPLLYRDSRRDYTSELEELDPNAVVPLKRHPHRHPAHDDPMRYDVEKVLREQTRYDLICPICGALITKKIILRKKKKHFRDEADTRWRRRETAEIVAVEDNENQTPRSDISSEMEDANAKWNQGIKPFFSYLFGS